MGQAFGRWFADGLYRGLVGKQRRLGEQGSTHLPPMRPGFESCSGPGVICGLNGWLLVLVFAPKEWYGMVLLIRSRAKIIQQ